jgi:hypothetical protein
MTNHFPRSKKLWETAIAAKETVRLLDQSTFLRNNNSDCVTNEESQLTQEWEKLAKDPQWRIVKNVMEPTFYHSQAGSDQQALHELQESQPKLTPLKAFETAIRDIDMEFSQESYRDNHRERCNRPENGATQASRCVHDSTSFPTGPDEG